MRESWRNACGWFCWFKSPTKQNILKLKFQGNCLKLAIVWSWQFLHFPVFFPWFYFEFLSVAATPTDHVPCKKEKQYKNHPNREKSLNFYTAKYNRRKNNNNSTFFRCFIFSVAFTIPGAINQMQSTLVCHATPDNWYF